MKNATKENIQTRPPIMNIGAAAKSSGISAKMIRHYESIHLIKPGVRSDVGYRTYNANDLHTLRFIKRARSLGFSLDQIRDLLSLWNDSHRASADVKTIAQAHVAELEKRIGELSEMRDTLAHLAHSCHGDARPECPILQGLATLDETGSKRCTVKKPDALECAIGAPQSLRGDYPFKLPPC
jgi:MerR family copper efflux transcriptional regulator